MEPIVYPLGPPPEGCRRTETTMTQASGEPSRSVLVIGAGSGIGRATAQLFARRGWRTLVADLSIEAVRGLAKEQPGVVAVGDCSWDATDPVAVDSLMNEAVAAAGSLDAVVTTVGWTAMTRFLDETPQYWRRIVDVNLMSAIYVAAAAAKAMKDHGGSIVFTASEAGKVGTSGESVYSATKGGVIALAKSLAREFARYQIRVNAVAPGVTDTPLLASQAGEETLASIVRSVPLRRLGKPEEMAAALAFLASDEASYITGQTLCVGGGLTMGS
jgi:NAD(P)-dependent dehydrogenase (short-subunit alcohol dehydrogenase family)